MRGSVLIMAAGTGGHVFPALACAEEFQARGYQVHWLGTPNGMENEIVPSERITFHAIDMKGVRGKGVARLLAIPFRLLRATFQAKKIIKQLQPVCVVGFGGYVTVPGGYAARLGKVPLIIHEQNAVAGTANKVLAKFAHRVCQAFPRAFSSSKKLLTTGNPVRRELFLETPRAALKGRAVRLLVLGGSLGAEPLNKMLPQALSLLADTLTVEVIHQSGRNHADTTAKRYTELNVKAKVVPFIKDMASAYGWADLVICRAGALTVSEIAAAGVASFLIPLPHAIDDHQTANARFLADQGAALLLAQAHLTAEKLAEKLTEVLMNKHQLVEMGHTARSLAKPDATNTVVSACLEVVNYG